MSQSNATPQQEESNVVFTLPRHEGEEIHFTLHKYNGRYYIDLRLWFQDEDKGEFKPTKKGISVGVEMLPQIQEGLEHLKQAYVKVREWEKEQPKKPAASFQKRPSWQRRESR
jgi:hypothetical protein